MNDGEYTGVLDRFEETPDGEVGVVLLECDGEVVDELVVPVERLPEDAGQDAILEMTIVDGECESIAYDPEKTQHRQEAAQDRFDRLAERPPDEDS